MESHPSPFGPRMGSDSPGPDDSDRTCCSICNGWSYGNVLRFERQDGSTRHSFDLVLCERCAERLEKHLKRAIPKRLMRVVGAL
jgi:hypothetical protein